MLLRYRDAALDWLPGGAPRRAIALGDGEAHRLPCDAWVDIRTGAGSRASADGGVTLGLAPPRARIWLRRLGARVARVLRRQRTGRRGHASDDAHGGPRGMR